MLYLISPAKKLDFSEESRYTHTYSQPRFLPDTEELVGQLAGMKPAKIGELMHISENLSKLNHDRYQTFHTPFGPENAKQALLSFKGDVYLSFELESYGEEEFDYAQEHLRILSGLYGLLRPLDLMQPYRLEMGTKLKNKRGKNLYEFWGGKITQSLNEEIQEKGHRRVINLASNEYFKSVKPKDLKAEVITPVFKEEREGTFKSIFLYAKQARGLMCDFAIKEKINKVENLKDFQGMGYAYNDALSSSHEWVFTRKS